MGCKNHRMLPVNNANDCWWTLAKCHWGIGKKGLVGDPRRYRNNKQTYERMSTKKNHKQKRLRRWISNCDRYPSIETMPRSKTDHLYTSLTIDRCMIFVKGDNREESGPWHLFILQSATLSRRWQAGYHIEHRMWLLCTPSKSMCPFASLYAPGLRKGLGLCGTAHGPLHYKPCDLWPVVAPWRDNHLPAWPFSATHRGKVS